MNKIIFIAILLAIFGCNQTNKKKSSTNVENIKETDKSANNNGFVDYAEDPVVLTMGADGEFDAGALGSMTIVKVAGVYHMYYEAWARLTHLGGQNGEGDDYVSLQIGHATSTDGIKWDKDPNNPVIPVGDKGEWDEDGTWDPFVIYEDGIFKMWYGGGVGSHCDWGYATSTDGVNFEKKGQISHSGDLEDIHVVHNPFNDKYYLYCWNRKKALWNDVMDSIPPHPSGLFVSISDNETDFDFDNAQRIEIKGQEWPAKYSHVIREEDAWVMIYGEAVTRGNGSSTGIATSSDLIHWEKRAFPVVKGHDAEIVKMGEDEWYLYYGPYAHFDWPNCDIRLATYKGKLSDLFED
jgi:predicted GH43/DUF377 family glycosyl hydrolase